MNAARCAIAAMVMVTAGACRTSTPKTTTPTTAVESDEVADPSAVSAKPPDVPPGLAPASRSCRTGDPLANVYHPTRLTVVRPCITVTGVVAAVRAEPDGDLHINVDLDAAFAALVNDRNTSGEHGALVVEIVPADEPGCTPGRAPRPASGTYDYGRCTGADEAAPTVRVHVSVTGPYVLDAFHGWMEIHPAWAVVATG